MEELILPTKCPLRSSALSLKVHRVLPHRHRPISFILLRTVRRSSSQCVPCHPYTHLKSISERTTAWSQKMRYHHELEEGASTQRFHVNHQVLNVRFHTHLCDVVSSHKLTRPESVAEKRGPACLHIQITAFTANDNILEV